MNKNLALLADIGGTHARFALTDGVSLLDEQQLQCADFLTIELAVDHYLGAIAKQHPIQQAALSIAAPLTGDQVNMTNHHWQFSISALRQRLCLRRLIVLNDFTALAMAIRYLPQDQLKQLGGISNNRTAPIALLGAGTGLGVSGLVPSDTHWLPLQGEGGHVSLAPGNTREGAVIKILWQRFGHVSAERVLSGPGLVNLYIALCELEGLQPQLITAAEISERGMSGGCAICAEVLQLFCALFGSVAGNLVLTLGATRALYIGGGIVPRLGDYFVRSDFRQRFEGKGRYVNYLQPVPVYVIHSPHPAFVGLMHSFTLPGPRIESNC